MATVPSVLVEIRPYDPSWPQWFEHRVLRREPRLANLHVFIRGCAEVEQMTGFRDWLRTHPADGNLTA